MKRLVILGGGESGVGAAILGQKKDWDVFVSDKGKIAPRYAHTLDEFGIRWEENTHTEHEILSADCIVKSPGIPDTVEIVRKAKQNHIEIISEIEFAYRYTQGKIIAITGSNGKTTTTSFLYHVLKNAGLNVAVVGNIGKSFAQVVAQDDKEYYVLEISSFQLDGIVSFKPYIAILLNITPDHLDRYEYNFDHYVASKFRIIENQDANDFFIYDADDKVIENHLKNYHIQSQKIAFSLEENKKEGVYISENNIIISMNDNIFDMKIEDIAIKGKHNVKNSMAVAAAAEILRIRKESTRKSMTTFKGEPHRLEFVRELEGVRYINDSKATNVNSVYYALDTITTPIIWIVGGQDKGNDYGALMTFVKEKVKAIVCLGVDNQKIIHFFKDDIEDIFDTHSMNEAVEVAHQIASQGDTVLLSPACASFDLFENYEHRGDWFKEAVRNIK